jgi:hypothetical protein
MAFLFVLGYLGTFILGPLSAVNDSMESNPKVIMSALFIGLTLLFFPRAELAIHRDNRPKLFRRFVAAHIDLSIAMLSLFGFLFPILLLIENSVRDEWVWSWDSAESPFYVPALVLGIFFCFVGMYFYFKIHLERGRSTPGQYIMGYMIVPVGTPNYNRRIWNGLFWFWLWFLAFAARTETEGVYSWDKNSNTQAFHVA